MKIRFGTCHGLNVFRHNSKRLFSRRSTSATTHAATSALRNEEVAACVVADVDLRENNLLELCRKTLSPWQVPKRIFIVDAIPTNERGKISRRDLARRFSADQTSSSLPTLGA